MYHAVTQGSLPDPMQMSLPGALFGTHMARLRELDVDIVPLADGVRRIGAHRRPAVAVVFDDGFVGVHDHALAAIRAQRIPATVFVTTGWIGLPEIPGGDRRLGRPMTWTEVRTLREAGCTIGSHSHTHPVMTTLADDDLAGELRRSRDAIEGETGQAPAEFAYPFGSYGTFDTRTRAALAAAGFEVACTTVWGHHTRTGDPLAVRRLRLSWVDTARELEKALAGCYDWYRLVQRRQSPPTDKPADPEFTHG